MEEPAEVWPPAPQGGAKTSQVPPVPRPALWLQIGNGLPAGIVFVPVVWICLRLLFHHDTGSVPQLLVGVSFLFALTVSALTWRRCRAFAVTFAVASAMAAYLPLWFCSLDNIFG